MVAAALKTIRRIGKGVRGVEEAVGFSLGHQYRIEIVAALHEEPESAAGLAKIIGKPLSTVAYHIEGLLQDGWIEIAYTQPVGNSNMTQHFYRVIKLPEFSDEEILAMSKDERQALAALIIHASTSEALASLWAGKLSGDPRVVLMWDRINLDKRGREALANELARSWRRVKKIACQAANRMAKTKDEGVTYVVMNFGFERCRTVAPEPLTSGKYGP